MNHSVLPVIKVHDCLYGTATAGVNIPLETRKQRRYHINTVLLTLPVNPAEKTREREIKQKLKEWLSDNKWYVKTTFSKWLSVNQPIRFPGNNTHTEKMYSLNAPQVILYKSVWKCLKRAWYWLILTILSQFAIILPLTNNFWSLSKSEQTCPYTEYRFTS